MQVSTPPRLTLHFDEDDIEQCVRAARDPSDVWSARNGTVALCCTLRDANDQLLCKFTVDAALLTPAVFAKWGEDGVRQAREERTFYYLNGLLRALQALRLRFRSLRVVEIGTDSDFLREHAHVARIAKWKKRGFKGSDGRPIRLRILWNQLYDWYTSPAVAFKCTFI